jgi:hypothetical protein
VAWSENARRAFFVKRYGEELGEEKFQEWMDAQNAAPTRQEGDAAAKPKAKPRSRKHPKLEHDSTAQVVAAGIATADRVVANFLYPPWRTEQLSDEEIGRLAHATADEILQSETLTRWFIQVMEFAGKGGAHTKFAIAVAYIMYPRMVRRGMIPDFLGQVATDATDVEGGGAHGDHWADGFGEVHPDVPLAGDPNAFRGPEEQGGFDQVPENTPHPKRGRNGRSATDEDHLEAALREAGAGVQ